GGDPRVPHRPVARLRLGERQEAQEGVDRLELGEHPRGAAMLPPARSHRDAPGDPEDGRRQPRQSAPRSPDTHTPRRSPATARPPDLLEVTYALGSEMLLAAGIEKTSKKARQRLANALASGLAAEKFEQVIEAQGGNPKTLEDPSVLPQAKEVEVYAAPRTGVVTAVEPRTIGRAVVAMGGGRIKVEDEVDPTVGFVITVKPGDKVLAGGPTASVLPRDPDGMKLGL